MSELLQSPFGRHSTASEVIEGVDLSRRRAIVTGASSGIGVETARAVGGRRRGHLGRPAPRRRGAHRSRPPGEDRKQHGPT